MASAPSPDSFELGDYLGVLRRRWWVVLLTTSLATLAAAGYVTLAPKTYTATATVYVTANAANANQLQGSRTSGVVINMDNEAQIAQSNLVAGPAAKTLHSTLPLAKLIKKTSVTVPANTTVMEIGCSASSPRGAAACAQAFGTSYLIVRAAAARGKIGFEAAQLQAREASLLTQAIKLKKQLRALKPNSPKRPLISTQIKNADSQISTLRADISALGGSVNYNPGSILTAAIPPTGATSPQPLLALPSGLLAGLLIGLVLAFVIDRRDDRIHSARDVERFLGLPVLFSMRQKRLGQVTTLAPPRSEAGQAFTELAEAVGAGLGDGNHVVAVTASSPGESGSIVAANLAAALARTRADVLLVGTDPQDTALHRLLGIGDRRGLAEVMAGTATIGEAARRVAEVDRLRVLTPGAGTAALVDHLDYDINQSLMTDLRRLARYVIVDVQATGRASDAFGLVEFADAAIVVVEISVTRKSDAAGCVGRLDRMRTITLGSAVLPAIRRPGKAGKSKAGKSTAPVRPPTGSADGAAAPQAPPTAHEEPPRSRKVVASSATPGPSDQRD
jgi:capsular polysaccharide biosynthesis protein/Mrp family chromosome partitioning ATPase